MCLVGLLHKNVTAATQSSIVFFIMEVDDTRRSDVVVELRRRRSISRGNADVLGEDLAATEEESKTIYVAQEDEEEPSAAADLLLEKKKKISLEKNRILTYVVRFMLGATCFLICFALQVLLILTFFFRSGLGGVLGFHLYAVISAALVLCAAMLCGLLGIKYAGKTGIKSTRTYLCCSVKYLGCAFVALILLTEVVLILLVPIASLFPWLASHDSLATSDGLSSECTQEVIHERWEAVQTFFNRSVVDFSSIRIVAGGAPFHFNNAVAMVVEDAIMIARDSCPSISLLVHEVVHVYQFQTGWWFGTSGPKKFFSWQIEQIRCRSCPYDYGNLATTFEDGVRNIFDLGPEKQAEIVEDYYLAGGEDGNSDPFLAYYAEQILNATKLSS